MTVQRSAARKSKSIPPPPGLEDGYDAIIAYFEKYSTEELEKAGYLEDVPAEEIQELEASAAYQLLCEEGLNLKLTRKDYERLSRLAANKRLPVETLAKRWIRRGLEEETKTATHDKR
jgi:hypothetical protein